MRRINLKELNKEELEAFIAGMGLPAYRARQMLHWIYEMRAEKVDGITVFSKDLRAELNRTAYISNLKPLERLMSRDGTEKYLFGLEDGETIESVMIPDEDRITLCVSSQAGCAMGCRFCRTGRDGLRRNLKAHEIVDQVITTSRLVSPRVITNIVLMGMGEPLQNLDEVADALWRMTTLLNISKRRITVSTSGVVPGLRELPLRAPEVNLAISLNATTDEIRDGIMPVNRKYPIKALLDACRAYPLGKRRRITFEYVMIDSLNDFPEDASRLARLLKGIPSKVNLIPMNEFEGCRLKSPPESRVLEFQNILIRAGLSAFIRKSRGQDILAACGQLRRARNQKAPATSCR